jgi:hypothetical protein
MNRERLKQALDLRHLCPDCHAITSTWCRRKARARAAV